MELEVLCRCCWIGLQGNKEHEIKCRVCLDKDTTKLVLVQRFLSRGSYLSLGQSIPRPVIVIAILFEGEA